MPGQTPHCARRTLATGSPLREVDSQARRGEIPPSAFGIPVSPWRRTCGLQWSDSPAALQGRFGGTGHALRIQFCVWVI